MQPWVFDGSAPCAEAGPSPGNSGDPLLDSAGSRDVLLKQALSEQELQELCVLFYLCLLRDVIWGDLGGCQQYMYIYILTHSLSLSLSLSLAHTV